MAKREIRRRRLAKPPLRKIDRPFPAPPLAPAPVDDSELQPPNPGSPSTPIAARVPWRRLLVGREHRHRLEIRIAHCSITEIEARSFVLGLYAQVAPTGAASAIDEALEGAVTEFTQRRMFSGRVGEVFMMPANRRQLPTDSILWIGLGYFDQFDDNVLQLAAENAVRTYIHTNIEDFATVLIGAGSGKSTSWLVENLITGLVRGKRDADRDHNFRRVTICEIDNNRYEEICQEVFRLASTPLCEDVELCISDVPVRHRRRETREVIRVTTEEPAYLIVRQETSPGSTHIRLTSSILTGGTTAAISVRTSNVRPTELSDFYQAVDRIKPAQGAAATLSTLRQLGAKLAYLILGDDIGTELLHHRGRHLVVVHDTPMSRLPWELLAINDWTPALVKGISRRYMADDLSIVKFLSQRVEQAQVSVLSIINPTSDLPSASVEGDRIKSVIDGRSGFKLRELRGSDASRAELITSFQSGAYDVVHYAGHAFFDRQERSRSGLICAGGDVLTGEDLVNLPNLPSLVVFNACESGLVRNYFNRSKRAANVNDTASLAEINVGLAEAMLRGGIANFVGTYWPVYDNAAAVFAKTFYDSLLNGLSIGAALTSARQPLQDQERTIDWADYIHYGNQDFTLARR
jgi:CHAT domain-containing protein